MLVRLLEQSRVFSQPERRARILQRTSYDDDFGMARWTATARSSGHCATRDAAAAEAIMISDASGGLHDLLEEAPAPARPATKR